MFRDTLPKLNGQGYVLHSHHAGPPTAVKHCRQIEEIRIDDSNHDFLFSAVLHVYHSVGVLHRRDRLYFSHSSMSNRLSSSVV